MSASLDGYIVGPNGGFDWNEPDADVFGFWIDEIRTVGVHLLGRRLYETMLCWETADKHASLDAAELEWTASSSRSTTPFELSGEYECRVAGCPAS